MKMTSKKNDCISLGPLFQMKALQAPFLPKFYQDLPKFPLTFPKRGKLKHDLQKNVCSFILGAIFLKSKEHTAILRKYTHFVGCGCAPCTPDSYTSVPVTFATVLNFSVPKISTTRFRPENGIRT